MNELKDLFLSDSGYTGSEYTTEWIQVSTINSLRFSAYSDTSNFTQSIQYAVDRNYNIIHEDSQNCTSGLLWTLNSNVVASYSRFRITSFTPTASLDAQMFILNSNYETNGTTGATGPPGTPGSASNTGATGPSLFQSVSDGTKTSIRQITLTENLVLGKATTTSNNKRFFYDPAKAYLFSGDGVGSNTTEALRGTNCVNFGENNIVLGNRITCCGETNSTDTNSSNIFTSGRDNILISTNGAVCLGNTNTIYKTIGNGHCFIAGENCNISGATGGPSAKNIYMVGTSHIGSNANNQAKILLGTKCTDGDYYGILLASGDIRLTATNNFQAMFCYQNGYTMYTNAAQTTGAILAGGASAWSVVSDREKKTDIVELNDSDLLNKIDQVPVYKFKYKTNPTYDENGKLIAETQCCNTFLMAQDFNKAYPCEKNQLLVDTGDMQGVMWSCIRELKKENDILKNKLNTIDERLTNVGL